MKILKNDTYREMHLRAYERLPLVEMRVRELEADARKRDEKYAVLHKENMKLRAELATMERRLSEQAEKSGKAEKKDARRKKAEGRK